MKGYFRISCRAINLLHSACDLPQAVWLAISTEEQTYKSAHNFTIDLDAFIYFWSPLKVRDGSA